jgi:hypothetical protein
MKMLFASTEQAARDLEAKAFDYVESRQHARGGGWSLIYSNGTKFGLCFDGSIAGAFTAQELGARQQSGQTVWDNVQECALTVRDQAGNVVTQGWDVVPDPEPEEVVR